MRFIKFDFDKMLNNAVFVIAFIMIVSQLIITVPTVSRLCGISSVSTSAEIFEEKTAVLRLALLNIPEDERIYVLQNGQSVACFSYSQTEVTVSDNSVIEIDGRAVKRPFDVEISVISGDVVSSLPEKIHVDSSIAMIGRVFLRDEGSK